MVTLVQLLRLALAHLVDASVGAGESLRDVLIDGGDKNCAYGFYGPPVAPDVPECVFRPESDLSVYGPLHGWELMESGAVSHELSMNHSMVNSEKQEVCFTLLHPGSAQGEGRFSITTASIALAALVGTVVGESHTVHFDNRCGHGTPMLLKDGKVLSKGADYTSNGPLKAAIAYLQTGKCGFNSEGCTMIEPTLVNPDPASPGSGSSVDISLIPPLALSVKSGFHYVNGCDGAGAVCDNQNCNTAFHKPDDTHVQVACQTPNVNLVITFCG